MRPLEGVRVLDFSRVLAGPMATQILAELGAEVTKVERPRGGGESRAFEPMLPGGESAYFLALNRAKRSLTLNLKLPRAQAIARQLAGRADVVLENFLPGDMDRLGLGYARLAAENPRLIYVMRVVVLGEEVPAGAMPFTALPDGPPVPPACSPDDILLIQYTSGTTSFPKGVMLPHRSMLANGFFSGARIGFRVGDRFHSARPFFHVAGSALSVLAAIQHAVTLVTMDRFEAAAALDLMEQERCTYFSGNDTMALMLLNEPGRAARRLALRGGWAAASPAILRRIVDELGARECVAGYGLSEAAPNVAQSAWWEPETVRVAARMRPQPGVEVRVRGPEGAAGEILVRGWNVMRGYWDKPDETRAALDFEGWLATGDLGRLGGDGRLEFLGRLKDIVRVGARTSRPPRWRTRCTATPRSARRRWWGVPDPLVVAAFVVPNAGQNCDRAAIIAWCRGEMAGFKVPRHVWVVDGFEAIGITASAKVQKTALAAHARRLMGQP